ncbi:carbohydrate ABC transporter permease [Actinomadura sp. HBU206391]|uniref:carbohydrate ABC transporter permease n=1 Tax=Actinomadura sp. HBU206391 TaxID=2731692 RepID=UPI001650B2F5|nr:sugar ABC transporter permease [Actinomadura sp. HBU206391]MBC6460140.1 sugar ABC transporter permease [Actinomadura sp. HBU206391]
MSSRPRPTRSWPRSPAEARSGRGPAKKIPAPLRFAPRPAWLADERTALPSLVVMAAWRGFGFDMVIFLAALQGIPRDLYEAAGVDGAGRWATFRKVTVPMLRPALLFTAVYSTIGYMQFLEEPLVMTQGGPLDSTLSASYAIYKQFGVGNYGYAGAAASVLFAVIVALSFLQFRMLRPRHH